MIGNRGNWGFPREPLQNHYSLGSSLIMGEIVLKIDIGGRPLPVTHRAYESVCGG
jgi:hypothetical protein